MATPTPYNVYSTLGDGEAPLTYAPYVPYAPHRHQDRWDAVERVPNPQPLDEPRWPPGAYPAENGFYGTGQYGPGGYGYAPGQLAGILPSSFAGYDVPTASIMRRPSGSVGPWERAGALVNGDGSKVLPLFVRQHGSGTDRYDFRTVVDKVPLEINDSSARGVAWLNDGDTTTVPGLGTFTAQIYSGFK